MQNKRSKKANSLNCAAQIQKTSPQRCYRPKQALQNDQGLHSRQVSACLCNSVPDLTKFLILKKPSVHGFDERSTKGCKCAPRLRQLQHLSATGQKTSHPQEEQSPHFVLRKRNTVPGKVPAIFTLVWEWWGLFGCCFKGSTSFPVPPSCIACRTRATTTGSKGLPEHFSVTKFSESQQ